MFENGSYMLVVIAIVLVAILVCLNSYNMNRNYAGVCGVSNDQPSALGQNSGASEIDISKLQDKDVTITMYYAPWCGISVGFMPEWTRLTQLASEKFTNVKTVMIDCEKDKDTMAMCEAKGIMGYPTIKVTDSSDNSREFYGVRRAENILAFALL